MVVIVNIPDELAARARARGLSLEAYVQEILAQQLAYPAETRQLRTARRDSRLARLTGAVFGQDIPAARDHFARVALPGSRLDGYCVVSSRYQYPATDDTTLRSSARAG